MCSPPAAQTGFWAFPTAPTQIYALGVGDPWSILGQLPQKGLAIVGTRTPQARTRVQTRDLIRQLHGQDLIIVSGMASGIDAEAHEAALEYGLPTVAVLGTPPDRIYPPENRRLCERIIEAGGWVVTEIAPGQATYPSHFLRRNRLIAGWSKAVCVMEAGYQSGALNTAYWSRRWDRYLLALPCYPGDPVLAGNQKLLDDGHAHALWGAHSLGVAWLGLSTLRRTSAPARSQRPRAGGRAKGTAQEQCITRWIEKLSQSEGGAQPPALYDAFMQEGHEPGAFYVALREGLESGRLLEKKGLLLKNPIF